MADNVPLQENQVPGNSGPLKKRSALGRWAGLGVFAAVALPIVAAYTVYYTGVGMPTGTVNEGELLVPPHSVSGIDMRNGDGNIVSLSAEAPKWRYLIVGDKQCGSDCEKLLYTTRQVHIRLGDKAERVERLLVTDAPLEEERYRALASEHPRLRFTTASGKQLDQWLADSDHPGLKRPSALLVDQEGFAMMVYDNHHSGNQLLKDIKRLLKYSYEK